MAAWLAVCAIGFGKAAEQGDAEGQYFLASMYDFGKGTAENKAEAIRWYKKAAEQDHEGAKKRLGAITK